MQMNGVTSRIPGTYADSSLLFALPLNPAPLAPLVPQQASAQPAFSFVSSFALPQGSAAPSVSLMGSDQEASLEQVQAGRIVASGEKGPAVQWLQTNLKNLGYHVEATGVLDAACETQLKKFQQDYGVQPTGQFGPTTQQAVAWAVKQTNAIQQLRKVTPAQLKHMNPSQFFQALLPAALESERKYNVPAAVTLAQAALESGYGASAIGGYNIFGIKGRGPAGSVTVSTAEYVGGQRITIQARFAKYFDFYEAVSSHGKLFHNGNFNKGIQQFAKDHNTNRFIDNIAGTYATDPHYARSLKAIIQQYGLGTLVNQAHKIPA